MNLYEIPPNNCLFSRQWRWHYDSLNDRDRAKSEWLIYEKVVHKNIDSTNKKLEDLEKELQDKLLGIPHDDPTLVNIGRIAGLKTSIHTIHYLKKHIGIWRISGCYEDIWADMTYPNKLHILNTLYDDVLGCSRSGDVCVVMLSDKAVKWLNGIRILHKTVDPSFYSTASF